jgi:Domain of unknown function (DUF5916)
MQKPLHFLTSLLRKAAACVLTLCVAAPLVHAQVQAQVHAQSAAPSSASATAAAPALSIDAIQAARLLPGEAIVLDGSLSHPAWQRAPVHSRFIGRDPVFGADPPQRTHVQVLFNERALYVGVTAFDTRPHEMRAPMVRADQVNRTQDFVVVYIDAIGTKRAAQFFRVNAAGSMGDGLHTAADDNEDFSPDFDWDAAVQRTLPASTNPQLPTTGWTAVFRLPFASLRFAPGQQDWRIMVGRRLPREQFHMVTSVPVPRDVPSFIANMQPLQGVVLPADSQFLTVRPSVTVRREKPAGGDSETKATASLDVKWRPMAQAVVDATIRPDFSQVALDVPQLAGNSRFALYYPEKRPFFFESADLLRTPTEAFYTRSYTEPRWGLRGTWRSTSWAGTALALDDKGGGLVLLPGVYGTDAVTQPASRALAARARSDGGQLQWGGVVASRQYTAGRGDNTVLGPDVEWDVTEGLRMRGQWLHASTTAQPNAAGGLTKGAPITGDRVLLRAQHQGEKTEGNLTLEDVTGGFRHDSGFANQAGVRKGFGFAAYNWGAVGPFNQFFSNFEFGRTTDRRTGEVVSQTLRPGIWTTGASNLEWWAEWYAQSRVRTAPGAPLLNENYLATGLLFTPAAWFPMLDAKLTWGQIADRSATAVRPGGTFNLTTKLRPLASLELETTASTAWLRANGQRTYGETALQLLAVWHFNAQHNLRAIVDSTSLRRLQERDASGAVAVAADRSTGSTQSLTYAWRESAGTVLYVGASSSRQGGSSPRSSEMFVKLQVDMDEALERWRRR